MNMISEYQHTDNQPKPHLGMSKIELCKILLPQIQSTKEVQRFLCSSLSYPERLELRQALGNLFSPVTGVITRGFRLDLSIELDRRAALEMVKLSQAEKQFSKKRSGRADTSQHGNWENYRNATFMGKQCLRS